MFAPRGYTAVPQDLLDDELEEDGDQLGSSYEQQRSASSRKAKKMASGFLGSSPTENKAEEQGEGERRIKRNVRFESKSLEEKQEPMSKARRICFLISLMICTLTIFVFAFTVPCKGPSCTFTNMMPTPATEKVKSHGNWSVSIPGHTSRTGLAFHESSVQKNRAEIVVSYNNSLQNQNQNHKWENVDSFVRSGLLSLSEANGDFLWSYNASDVVKLIGCGTDIIHRESCLIESSHSALQLVNPRKNHLIWSTEILIGSILPSIVMRIGDCDGDGVGDILLSYDHVNATRVAPSDERTGRNPGRITVISGLSGHILARTLEVPPSHLIKQISLHNTHEETNLLFVLTVGNNSQLKVIPIRKFVVRMIEASSGVAVNLFDNSTVSLSHAVSASHAPVVKDLNQDLVEDLVLVTMAGSVHSLTAVDGGRLKNMWRIAFGSRKIQSQPVIGYFNDDDVLDILVVLRDPIVTIKRQSLVQILNGRNGEILWSRKLTLAEGTSPVSASIGHKSDAFFLWIEKEELQKYSKIFPSSKPDKKFARSDASHVNGGTTVGYQRRHRRHEPFGHRADEPSRNRGDEPSGHRVDVPSRHRVDKESIRRSNESSSVLADEISIHLNHETSRQGSMHEIREPSIYRTNEQSIHRNNSDSSTHQGHGSELSQQERNGSSILQENKPSRHRESKPSTQRRSSSRRPWEIILSRQRRNDPSTRRANEPYRDRENELSRSRRNEQSRQRRSDSSIPGFLLRQDAKSSISEMEEELDSLVEGHETAKNDHTNLPIINSNRKSGQTVKFLEDMLKRDTRVDLNDNRSDEKNKLSGAPSATETLKNITPALNTVHLQITLKQPEKKNVSLGKNSMLESYSTRNLISQTKNSNLNFRKTSDNPGFSSRIKSGWDESDLVNNTTSTDSVKGRKRLRGDQIAFSPLRETRLNDSKPGVKNISGSGVMSLFASRQLTHMKDSEFQVGRNVTRRIRGRLGDDKQKIVDQIKSHDSNEKPYVNNNADFRDLRNSNITRMVFAQHPVPSFTDGGVKEQQITAGNNSRETTANNLDEAVLPSSTVGKDLVLEHKLGNKSNVMSTDSTEQVVAPISVNRKEPDQEQKQKNISLVIFTSNTKQNIALSSVDGKQLDLERVVKNESFAMSANNTARGVRSFSGERQRLKLENKVANESSVVLAMDASQQDFRYDKMVNSLKHSAGNPILAENKAGYNMSVHRSTETHSKSIRNAKENAAINSLGAGVTATSKHTEQEDSFRNIGARNTSTREPMRRAHAMGLVENRKMFEKSSSLLRNISSFNETQPGGGQNADGNAYEVGSSDGRASEQLASVVRQTSRRPTFGCQIFKKQVSDRSTTTQGQTSAEQASKKHGPDRQTAKGQGSDGLPPKNQAPERQTVVRQTPGGQTSFAQDSGRITSERDPAKGLISKGQSSDGQVTDGNTPHEQIINLQDSEGQASKKHPVGRQAIFRPTSDGQVSSADDSHGLGSEGQAVQGSITDGHSRSQGSEKQNPNGHTSDRQAFEKKTSDRQGSSGSSDSDKQDSGGDPSDRQASEEQTSDKPRPDNQIAKKQAPEGKAFVRQSSGGQTSNGRISQEHGLRGQIFDRETSDRHASVARDTDGPARSSEVHASDGQTSDNQTSDYPAAKKQVVGKQTLVAQNSEGHAEKGHASSRDSEKQNPDAHASDRQARDGQASERHGSDSRGSTTAESREDDDHVLKHTRNLGDARVLVEHNSSSESSETGNKNSTTATVNAKNELKENEVLMKDNMTRSTQEFNQTAVGSRLPDTDLLINKKQFARCKKGHSLALIAIFPNSQRNLFSVISQEDGIWNKDPCDMSWPYVNSNIIVRDVDPDGFFKIFYVVNYANTRQHQQTMRVKRFSIKSNCV